MYYTQNKKRVCIRLDQAHLNFLQRKSLSINRTVNAALETFLYDYDHSRVLQWKRDDIMDPSCHIKHPTGTRSTQLRIEAFFYERMEMRNWVKSKVIWHALDHYIDLIREGRVAQYKLEELDESRKHWKI